MILYGVIIVTPLILYGKGPTLLSFYRAQVFVLLSLGVY